MNQKHAYLFMDLAVDAMVNGDDACAGSCVEKAVIIAEMCHTKASKDRTEYFKQFRDRNKHAVTVFTQQYEGNYEQCKAKAAARRKKRSESFSSSRFGANYQIGPRRHDENRVDSDHGQFTSRSKVPPSYYTAQQHSGTAPSPQSHARGVNQQQGYDIVATRNRVTPASGQAQKSSADTTHGRHAESQSGQVSYTHDESSRFHNGSNNPSRHAMSGPVEVAKRRPSFDPQAPQYHVRGHADRNYQSVPGNQHHYMTAEQVAGKQQRISVDDGDARHSGPGPGQAAQAGNVSRFKLNRADSSRSADDWTRHQKDATQLQRQYSRGQPDNRHGNKLERPQEYADENAQDADDLFEVDMSDFAFSRVGPQRSLVPGKLDQRYIKRRPKVAGEFFTVGRVFSIVIHEDFTGDAKHLRQTADEWLTRSHKGLIFSHVQRYAVVRMGHGYCWGIPISTYGGQGTSKSGIDATTAQAHAIAYSTRTPPQILPGEQRLTKTAIKIECLDDHYLQAASRINFAQGSDH